MSGKSQGTLRWIIRGNSATDVRVTTTATGFEVLQQSVFFYVMSKVLSDELSFM